VKLELVLLASNLRKMKRMKEKLGEAPKKKMKGGGVQFVGVGLQHPLAMLRQGGGASMVGERRELLHGLFRKRELERVRE